MQRANRDPLGYFAALGLGPGADAAAIKAAFHAYAKRLHPDRNHAPGSVAAFQRVSEAYRVLRDPLYRLSYETLGEGFPPVGTRPHACQACGQVSAQPRFVIFKLVRSCLVWGRQSEEAGIFCPSCARAAALRASLSTWLYGWWSLQGVVLTPFALFVNLMGGIKPRAQNFDLLLHQARAFAVRSEHEIAAALALQAHAFASGAHERDRLMQAARGQKGRRMYDRWRLPDAAFLLQLLPLASLLAITGAAAANAPDLPIFAETIERLRAG